MENSRLFERLERQMLRKANETTRYSPDRQRCIKATQRILHNGAKERRKIQDDQIKSQNVKFLERLQQTKANYNTVRWESDYKSIEQQQAARASPKRLPRIFQMETSVKKP